MHISHSKNGKTEVRLMRRTFQVRIGILPLIWRLHLLIQLAISPYQQFNCLPPSLLKFPYFT